MARTYKDRPAKIRFPKMSVEDCECYRYLPLGGIHAKKKRHEDTKWHWLRGEPRWFRNEFERKDRRATVRELFRFTKNPEHEVQLQNKPVMDYYW